MRAEFSRSDPSTFPTRLRGIVDAHGGASALARVIGRSEGAVRKWLRGESEPNVSDLRSICEATATNIDWLVSGANEREPAPWSQTERDQSGVTAADYTLLAMLLERVDTELALLHFKDTAPKRAALIVTLFQLFRNTKTIDPDALKRVLTLVRS
jgi:transcriptional regulator with XRE-family HTH domain